MYDADFQTGNVVHKPSEKLYFQNRLSGEKFWDSSQYQTEMEQRLVFF